MSRSKVIYEERTHQYRDYSLRVTQTTEYMDTVRVTMPAEDAMAMITDLVRALAAGKREIDVFVRGVLDKTREYDGVG